MSAMRSLWSDPRFVYWMNKYGVAKPPGEPDPETLRGLGKTAAPTLEQAPPQTLPGVGPPPPTKPGIGPTAFNHKLVDPRADPGGTPARVQVPGDSLEPYADTVPNPQVQPPAAQGSADTPEPTPVEPEVEPVTTRLPVPEGGNGPATLRSPTGPAPTPEPIPNVTVRDPLPPQEVKTTRIPRAPQPA